MRLLTLLLALTLTSCASLTERAQTAAVADGVSTVGALALGAVELNPLGLLTIPAKVAVLAYARSLPDDERATAESLAASIWSGAAMSNVCTIIAIVTGGITSPVCIVAGIVVGVNEWRGSAAERQFYALCENAKQRWGETLPCRYHTKG